MNNNVNDLSETVQKLRDEKYPDIPEDLVAEILVVETNFLEARAESSKRIARAVDTYLGEKEVLD